MEETAQQIDAHNAQVLRDEVMLRLESIAHEVEVLYGLLDDLAVYLPKDESRDRH